MMQNDKQKMFEIYDKWPDIAKNAYSSNLESVNFDNPNHLVFVGMGGSGTVCDLFFSLLSQTSIHVDVIKGYRLPSSITSDSLVIPISVSGNSAETLSVLEKAYSKKCKIIAFSSGGKIEQFCKKNKITFRKIDLIHSPRASLVHYIYSIVKILEKLLPISQSEVLESISELEQICKKINSDNISSDNPSLKLAEWIKGIPLIYYPYGFETVAVRFKNSLQENSKIHVIIEDVIEACHNNIVAWEKDSNVQPILIRGTDDNEKTKERWEILKEYFNYYQIPFYEFLSLNGNILSKLIALVYQLDYASIYHALIHDTDPSEVKSINFVKERL